MTRLTRITVYPIKSLDGVEVSRANILRSGSLEGDRRYGLIDADENFVNGKRNRKVHAIRAAFSSDLARVSLSTDRSNFGPQSLSTERGQIGNWLSREIGKDCRLIENAEVGFPDDADSPGPTVISTQSLEAIAGWFDLTLDECRRRFRTNLEVDAPHAFWEDCLVGREFSLGGVVLHGANV
ncbi:MAG: MOSC N-terminal beta barrel domain-containing protein, partial [Planctomycetales bacterium]|nr:MOSC N-terminal beta barrel domain-containing protein [Planctomycetales bacterium]